MMGYRPATAGVALLRAPVEHAEGAGSAGAASSSVRPHGRVLAALGFGGGGVEELGDEVPYSFRLVFLQEVAAVG